MLSGDYDTKITVNKKEFLDSIDRATLLVKESEKKPIIIGVKDGDEQQYCPEKDIGQHSKAKIHHPDTVINADHPNGNGAFVEHLLAPNQGNEHIQNGGGYGKHDVGPHIFAGDGIDAFKYDAANG